MVTLSSVAVTIFVMCVCDLYYEWLTVYPFVGRLLSDWGPYHLWLSQKLLPLMCVTFLFNTTSLSPFQVSSALSSVALSVSCKDLVTILRHCCWSYGLLYRDFKFLRWPCVPGAAKLPCTWGLDEGRWRILCICGGAALHDPLLYSFLQRLRLGGSVIMNYVYRVNLLRCYILALLRDHTTVHFLITYIVGSHKNLYIMRYIQYQVLMW